MGFYNGDLSLLTVLAMVSFLHWGVFGSTMGYVFASKAIQSSMSVLSKGQTVSLGGVPYFIPGKPEVSDN